LIGDICQLAVRFSKLLLRVVCFLLLLPRGLGSIWPNSRRLTRPSIPCKAHQLGGQRVAPDLGNTTMSPNLSAR
jgi:hypothetical protein